MIRQIKDQIKLALPYLAPDVLVPALMSLLGLYLFVYAVFSLERVA